MDKKIIDVVKILRNITNRSKPKKEYFVYYRASDGMITCDRFKTLKEARLFLKAGKTKNYAGSDYSDAYIEEIVYEQTRIIR